MTRPALLALTLLSLAGCDRRARDAFVRGEASLKEGDLRAAALELRSACRLDPENAEYCRRADEIGAKVRADAIPRAMAACDQGDGLRCIEELRLVDDVMPGPEVTQLLERGAALYLQRCDVQVVSLADAMFKVRCTEAIHDRVRTPGYLAAARAARAGARDLARSLSAQQPSPAAALGYTSVGLCFQRDPQLQAEANRLEAVMRAQLQWRLGVETNFSDSRALCERVARTDSRVSCLGPASATARFELDAPTLRHTVSDVDESKEYVSAAYDVENPAWRDAQVRVAYLQGVSEEADAAAKKAQRRCGDTEQCRAAQKARDHAREKREELDAARRTLSRLDRTVRHEEKSIYRWVRRTHTWTLSYRVRLSAGGLTDGVAGTVSWTGDEQASFQPAGVEGLVAMPPSQGDLDGAIWSRSVPRFVTLVQASMAASGAERRQGCATIDLARADQVQCGAEVAFLTGESVRGLLVGELARGVDARQDLPQYAALVCE